jgi:hypothetical protein
MSFIVTFRDTMAPFGIPGGGVEVEMQAGNATRHTR